MYIYICWLNLEALAQGYAYNPHRDREIIMDHAGI